MKNKNTNTSLPKKRGSYSTGVFLIIIALLWFASFKLFNPDVSIRDIAPNNDEDIPISSAALFSEAEDYPVLIIFDNHPDSQAYLEGISEAAVVYEWLAEGGATRFAGVYSGAPTGG